MYKQKGQFLFFTLGLILVTPKKKRRKKKGKLNGCNIFWAKVLEAAYELLPP